MKLSYIIFVVLFTTLSVLVNSSSTTWSTWWGSNIQPKLSSVFPKKMPKLIKKLPIPKALLLGISLLEPIVFSKKQIKQTPTKEELDPYETFEGEALKKRREMLEKFGKKLR